MALFYIFVDFILEGPFWVEISSNGEKILPHQNWAKQGFKKCKMANLFWEKNMKK